jgi:hypothetical protein
LREIEASLSIGFFDNAAAKSRMSARANAIRPYEKNEKEWMPDQVGHDEFRVTTPCTPASGGRIEGHFYRLCDRYFI